MKRLTLLVCLTAFMLSLIVAPAGWCGLDEHGAVSLLWENEAGAELEWEQDQSKRLDLDIFTAEVESCHIFVRGRRVVEVFPDLRSAYQQAPATVRGPPQSF